MLIEITNSAGGSSATLVHGPGKPSATYAQGPLMREQSFASQQQIQVQPLTRSQFPAVHPRGNVASSYPFRAAREFDTTAAALTWAAAHAKSLEGLTRLKLTDGTLLATLHGGMDTANTLVRGCSVEIDYVFTYGEIT